MMVSKAKEPQMSADMGVSGIKILSMSVIIHSAAPRQLLNAYSRAPRRVGRAMRDSPAPDIHAGWFRHRLRCSATQMGREKKADLMCAPLLASTDCARLRYARVVSRGDSSSPQPSGFSLITFFWPSKESYPPREAGPRSCRAHSTHL